MEAMFKMCRSLLLLAVLMSFPAQGAEVRTSDISADTYVVTLIGKIEHGDYDRLVAVIKKTHAFPSGLWINSPGGDVVEATKIGSLARKALLQTVALGQCDSACFILWVGGAVRSAWVPIGIHRPVYDKSYFSNLSAEDARKKYSELDQAIREYLDYMNVPRALAEEMMQTPSDRARFIWKSEVSEKIGEQAPSYYEWLLAKCGNLSQKEQDDLQLVFMGMANEGAKKKLQANTRDSDARKMVRETETDAQRANKFSKGYVDYLLKKGEEQGTCKASAIRAEQQKILKTL